MGILNWIGLGDQIAKPIDSIGKLYTTDKDRLDAQLKHEEILQKTQSGQSEINKIFASSDGIFKSGWQPLIAWTCGFLVLLYYAPQIIIVMYVWGRSCILTGVVTPFPMKPDDILNLVWLLFGFGGYSLGNRAISKLF